MKIKVVINPKIVLIISLESSLYIAFNFIKLSNTVLVEARYTITITNFIPSTSIIELKEGLLLNISPVLNSITSKMFNNTKNGKK